MQDIRYALRIAQQNPGSTFAAFIALTLGIGATTAIFSVINSVILRPLPIKDPDEVVQIFETKPGNDRAEIAMPDYLDWKAHLKSFNSLAIYRESQANFTGAVKPERARLFLCESTMLPLLGLNVMRGRNFAAEEDEPGHNDVAILTWPFWRNHFGGENVIGKKIILDDHPYTITGVLKSSFLDFEDEDILVPVAFDLKQFENARGYHQYSVIGRLRPGVSLSQADAELTALSRFLATEYPKENGDVGARAVKLRDTITGDVRPVLFLLFGAVTCVLLIACGNVAGLLLARASGRQREISVRIAIGASRATLYRQVLTESILLSCSAAVAGVGLALVAVRIVRGLKNTGIPDPASIAIDWRVLAFAIGTGVLTGILFGLAPALGFSSEHVNEILKQSSGRVTESKSQHRLRQLFVALETAVAALLLIESGLLLKSFVKVSSINPGFSTDHVLTLQISLPRSQYGGPGTVGPFVREAIERIRSIPGLQSVAVTSKLPLLGSGLCSILIEGMPPAKTADNRFVQFSGVSPGYFRTLGISMLGGRDFTDRDTVNSTPVVIVNEALVRRFFAGHNPIGRRLAYYSSDPHWKQIVGVVADVRQHGIEAQPVPEMFTPLAQDEFKWLAITARTAGDPLSFTAAIQTEVQQVNPELAVFLPRSMEQIITRELGWRAFHTWLLVIFAAIAITLASIGIYAVIAYSVAQRLGEMGVRMALGAERSDIVRMVVWQGVMPALIGAVVGAACSLGISRLISRLLYGVQPIDPLTYVFVVLILLAVAAAAAYFPAHRAASVDPAQALRYQ